MDDFLPHKNQTSIEENKKVQTGLQIFQMLDHFILNIKMVSLLPAGGKEAFTYVSETQMQLETGNSALEI